MSESETDERPALGRAAIVAAARRIADSEGLAALTLRRIASEFDTGQASLYRHIANRAELLQLLADDLTTSYPVVRSDGAGSTADVVRQWGALYHHLADHPWAARLIAEGVYLGRGADDTARVLIEQLERLGLDADTSNRVYRGLWRLTLGHLLSDHPFGQPHTDGARDTKRFRPERVDEGYAWDLRRYIGGQTESTRQGRPASTRGRSVQGSRDSA